MCFHHERIGAKAQPAGRLPVALAAAALFALLPAACAAASICRWVDENGRPQISDVVPERYKGVASCIDSRLYELSPEQRQEADQRARARRAAASAPMDTASAAAVTAPATPPPVVKRPVDIVTDATDCPTWWRLYDESSACFGPHRTVRGGIKPEAFDLCNEVPSPELKCGLRSN